MKWRLGAYPVGAESLKILADTAGSVTRLRSVKSGEYVHELNGDSGAVAQICFNPDNKILDVHSIDSADGKGDHSIQLWSVELGQRLRNLVPGGKVVPLSDLKLKYYRAGLLGEALELSN